MAGDDQPAAVEPTSTKRPRAADDSSDQGPGSRRKAVRKRAALACDECRVRKRRCDGVIPACGGCTRRRSTCVYSSEVEARAWQSSTIQSLRSRLEELEAAEAAEEASSGGPTARNGNVVPRASTQASPSSVSGSRARRSEPRLSNHQQSHDQNYGENSQRNHQQTATNTLPSPPELCRPGYPEPRSFEKLMRPISRAVSQQSNTLPSPRSTSAISRHPLATNCTCERVLSTIKWSLPLRRVADGLIDTYFSRVQRIYPILHQRSFREQYRFLWESGSGAAPAQCSGLCRKKNRCKLLAAMLQAIFALATLLRSGPPEENAAQADAFFRKAQGLDFLDILDDEVGLELVQLGLIMGFYLQGTERFSKCWNITGVTIRLAQNMGLHLSLAEARKRGLVLSRPTQLEYEMRSRVWYGCVILEREVSMSFGRKLMGPIGGRSPRLPDSTDDDRLSDEPGKWNAQPNGLPSLMDSFIQTAKLYDILDELLDREELHEPITPVNDCNTSSGGPSNIRTLLDLDNMIMEWRDQLPAHLRYNPNSTDLDTTDALTPDGLQIPRADLPIQAERLHLRFLHVRMLILRPALDQLFERQQEAKSGTGGRQRESRLEDVVLCNVAMQCVQCAQDLVVFLDGEIRSQNFLAWWYNVSHLHSCASTILIGQLCNFGDGRALEESLPASLDMCLEGLSRYTELSSTSRKSLLLLREYAKSLVPTSNRQRNHGHPLGNTRYPPPQGCNSSLQGSRTELGAQDNQRERTSAIHSLNGPTDELPREFSMHPQSGLDVDPLEDLDEHFGLGDYGRASSWPFLPFLSQLEAMPIDFDAPNLMG